MRYGLAILLIASAPCLGAAAPDTSSLPAEVLALMERELPGWERQAPAGLLLRALEEAERAFPDSLALRGPDARQVWLRTQQEGRVEELALPLPDRLAQLPGLMHRAQAFLQRTVTGGNADLRQEADFALVRGLLNQADPHAQLLTEEPAGGVQVDAGERFGGIGMILGARDGFLAVISVLAKSPAERAGIQPGDRVLEIDEHSALGLPVYRAARLVKGPVGSRVNLAVLRRGEYAPRSFTLVRQDVAAPRVQGHVLHEARGQRIGYLRIDSFLPPTANEVRGRILRMLPDQADFLGLVLDLRDNGGGLLDQAIQVADLLLDSGRIVSLQGPRLGSETVEARSYRQITQAPVIVLIDERTASAAEIVAAALKSNRRALIVGSPSHGKTTIQSVFPLPGGNALKLTVARFITGGTDAAGHVVPHLLLSPIQLRPESGVVSGLAGGRATFGAFRTGGREATLPLFALDYLDDARPGAAARGWSFAHSASKPPVPGDDFALALARLILFANHRRAFDALVEAGLEIAAAEQGRQQGRVEARLRQSGTGWSAGGRAANPAAAIDRVTLEQRRSPGLPWQALQGQVLPGAEMRIGVSVRNRGIQPLHRVLAVLRTEALGLAGLEFPLGLVPPGELRTVSRTARLSPDQPAGVEGLDLRLLAANGPALGEARLLLPIAAGAPPALRVALHLESAQRDAPGAPAHLRVDIYPSGPAGEIGLAVNRGRTGVLWQPQAWELFPPRPAETALHFDLPLRFPAGAGAAEPELGLRILGLPDKALALSCQVRLPALRSPNGRMLESPTIRAMDLPPLAAPSPLVLTVQARDDKAVAALLVWLNGRKVFDHFSGSGSGGPLLEVAVPLTLDLGRNVVTIEARDDDGFSSRRSYVLWHEREAVLAAQATDPRRPFQAGNGVHSAGGFLQTVVP